MRMDIETIFSLFDARLLRTYSTVKMFLANWKSGYFATEDKLLRLSERLINLKDLLFVLRLKQTLLQLPNPLS